jgi:hypothetical protein
MAKFFMGVLVGLMAMRFGPGLIDSFNSDVGHFARMIHVA